jgi:surfeit locus 1 family protein
MPDHSKPSRRIFKPRWLPSLAVVPLLALLLSLSHWQYQRGVEKTQLVAQFLNGPVLTAGLPPNPALIQRYSRVHLSGQWDGSHALLLDNMTHAGAVGYRVWCPAQLSDGRWVIVDRGFIAASPNRQQLPDVSLTPSDANKAVVWTGIVDDLPRPGVSVAPSQESGWPRRVNYPTWRQIETLLGHPVVPWLILLDPTEPRGFSRDWHPGGLPPERHFGYALQWALLALTLAVGFYFTQLRPVASEAESQGGR